MELVLKIESLNEPSGAACATPERLPSGSQQPEQWVELYGDVLFRVALARINDRDTAEDLVQETFLAAWKGRDSFDGRASLETWLVAILKRKVVDHFRRSGRKPTTRFDDDADQELFDSTGLWKRRVREFAGPPESEAERDEFWEIVSACVSDLPGPLAETFLVREMQSQPTPDACARLGITAKNLSVRMHRARLLLRRCLEGKWF